MGPLAEDDVGLVIAPATVPFAIPDPGIVELVARELAPRLRQR